MTSLSPLIPAMHDTIDPRTAVLTGMRGSTVRIRGLIGLFDTFPYGINPHRDQLTTIVNSRLDSLYPDNPEKAAKFKKCDFALFGATWWPHVGFEELKIVTFFSMWLFLWDDEYDSKEGTLYDKAEASKLGHYEALSYFNQCLRLQHGYSKVSPSNPVVFSFKEVADELCEFYDIELRDTFFQEFLFYVAMVEAEQELHFKGIVPSLEKFLSMRWGTSAAKLSLLMNAYSVKRKVPECLKGNQTLDGLWEDTVHIVSIVNDLLSLKKEIESDAIDSFVPIAFNSTHDMQLATDKAVDLVRAAVDSFHKNAQILLADSRACGLADDDILWFIEGCQYQITGNIEWSLRTPRYGMAECYDPVNREICFTL